MKNFFLAVAVFAAMAIATVACSDNVSTMGSSLVNDQVEIVVDSTFTLDGYAIESSSVPARTTLQLLGSIEAEGYGSFASSVVTQLFPSESMETEGVTAEQIDSVKMIMRVPNGAYVGDSLMPMGVTVYPLTRQLPPAIHSDFDPSGYYDADAAPLCSTVYTLTAAGYHDKASIPYRYISLDIDPAWGRALYNKYLESPATFATPEAFASYFPGVYIRNSFGQGRVVQIDSTVVTLYYRQILPIEGEKRDTIINRSSSYLAVAPEILTNNNIRYKMAAQVSDMVAQGMPLMVAPTGYDVVVDFPGRELVAAYRSSGSKLAIVNALSLSIPAETVTNDFGIKPPTYVLMVLRSEKDNFFRRTLLPDNKTSFYATYNAMTGTYDFDDMRDYILSLLDKDEIKDEDVEFVVCPVTIGWQKSSQNNSYYYYYLQSASTSTYTIATVTPYINSPSMTLLRLDKAKIKFTYSVQSL